MIKYFISYEDLLEHNIINKELNILSPELFIIKKDKKGEYKFQPLLYFTDITNDLSKFVIPINYDRKSIVMVELTKEESRKFDPLFIKAYEQTDKGTYKKIAIDNNDVNLISYNCLMSLNYHEMDLGTVVAVMKCKSDPKKLYISADRSRFLTRNNPEDRRNILKKQGIGCDLYFHTDNEVLLERFKDEVTTLKRDESNKYSLLNHRVFVIDSIPQDRVYDFSNVTKRCFYELCNFDSTPINIIEDDEKYYLSKYNVEIKEKKGYIINNSNIKNILCDTAIEPLINYINVYMLEDGCYKKIPLMEYITKYNTIKLNINKKPSN